MKRFWSKVDTSGECWNWTASTDHDGYGYFAIGLKTAKSHRVSWEISNGPIPAGMHVLHKCDNPRCVRPSHLFLGTNSDNMSDKVTKRRQARGVRHGHAALNVIDVWLMRKACELLPVSQRQVARTWGVDQKTVNNLVRGKSYQ